MPLRFLVDESSGQVLAERLRQGGHDVVFSPDWKPAAPDEEVCAKAFSEQRVVVTDDKGFGEMIFKQGRSSVGVMLIRWRGRDYDRLVEAVVRAVALHGEKLEKAFSVISSNRVRIRPLPKARKQPSIG